jgi:hypothetical protein
MRVAVRATEEAIIRLLRAGHPLPGNIVNREEETRLPVFQSVEAVPVRNYGIETSARIVLARGRKDVWFVDIKRRNTKVSLKDSEAFVEVRDKLQSKFSGQKVTGWLVTTSTLEGSAQSFIDEHECFATPGAAKR